MNALSKMLASLQPPSFSSFRLFSCVLGAALLSAAVQAQVPDRVGRIAYLAGDVQFYSESAQAWLPAQLNAPVSSRNSLFTGPDGRAEIRFGSTAVALDGQTQLDVQLLDDTRFKAGVPRGSIALRVPGIEADESYEVMAPGAAYALLQAGRFRVDATGSGSSVTVLAGLVNASVAGGSSAMVEAGQALSAANGDFVRSPARSSTLDSWAAQRDNALRPSQSARYVSSNMTGYEELDANGRWASDPDYGNVWYPTTYITPGWVPYRDGHWVYVAPWGWTWIDAAPWGFAPFHYGRWVLIGPRWAWMPGAYVRRPSYAPALVGFIGGNGAGNAAGNVAISISIGAQPAVGWYPLPPWEHYRPAYTGNANHIRNLNNFNIGRPPSDAWRMVEQQRVSANQVQGATVVPHEAFVGSRPAARAALPVAAPVLASPSVASVPVPAPMRSGVLRGENRGAAHQAPAAIVAPQASQSAPALRGDSPQPRQSVQPPGNPSTQVIVIPSRHEDTPRRGAPAAVAEPAPQARPQILAPEVAPSRVRAEAPPMRIEPRAEPRMEPRMEPRVESRAVQKIEPRIEPRIESRIEPRIEPRAESRQMQRIESPPPARIPAAQPQAQPEQRRASEPEHERHSHGESRGRE